MEAFPQVGAFLYALGSCLLKEGTKAMTTPLKIAFIKAGWHAEVVDQALVGFQTELDAQDCNAFVDIFDVPGAFEMPLLAKQLAEIGDYDAVVAAAFVVDGGIYRHEFVAQAVVDGLMRAQMDSGVPVFSVSLTPKDFDGSAERVAWFSEHFVVKGAEADSAVLAVLGTDLDPE